MDFELGDRVASTIDITQTGRVVDPVEYQRIWGKYYPGSICVLFDDWTAYDYAEWILPQSLTKL